jgi:uncharacterized repeat protein (TIGR01451 family)
LAEPGQLITYTIVVVNNGAGDATDAIISDLLPNGTGFVSGTISLDPPGAGTIGSPPFLVNNLSIAAGARVTVTFAAMLDNPWLFEPLITNTASITSPESIMVKSDIVTNTVLITPTVNIIKTGPATARISDTVVYTFSVTNIGNTFLHEVVVEDNLAGGAIFAGGDDDGDSILSPTETWIYTATYTIPEGVTGPVTNIGTVTATDIANTQTTVATDTHTIFIEFSPALTMTKQGPVIANIGDVIVYTFTVSHAPGSDGSPISNVTITDDVAGPAIFIAGDDDGDGLLEPGETWTFTVAYTPVITDLSPLINTGLVRGEDPNGQEVTATASHSTILKKFGPVLSLVKEGPATAKINDTVVFTFTIQHALESDGSAVGSVTVSDNKAGPATLIGGDGNLIGWLEGGEVWIYTANYVIKPSDPDSLVNIGTVSGRDQENDIITASDSHTTTLVGFAPVLFVSKDGPAVADIGQTIVFTFTVINVIDDVSALSGFQLDEADFISLASLQPGDGSAITITSIIDSVADEITFVSGDSGKLGLLDGGEGWIYTASHTVELTDPDPLVNTVTVTGLTRDARDISATAKHSTAIGPLSTPSNGVFLPVITKKAK